MSIIRSKFYQGNEKGYWQERDDLLTMVVLWPAAWLRGKAVTIHGDKYREIMNRVMIQAAANVGGKIKYRPAYLRMVIQSHFKIHGEEYYEAAKSVRNLLEATFVALGRPVAAKEPDPIGILAQQRDLLLSLKPKQKRFKTTLNPQPGNNPAGHRPPAECA